MSNIANGWTFNRGDGATPTEAFTEVPNTSRADPGAPTSPDIDVTHLGSTARESKPGLPAFGDFQAETIYTPDDTVHNAMRAEAPSATFRNYRLMDPTNTFGFQFSLAIATFVTAGYEVDGSLRNRITFKQQGAPTLVGDA
jgi:hypothetical protein